MAKGIKSAEQYQFAGKKKAQVLLRFSIKLPEPLWFRGMRSMHFFQPAWGLLLFFSQREPLQNHCGDALHYGLYLKT
ncbi:TPA: hypothetical protein RI761_002638 [Vibrio cholerae]|nr:hypothetical protein [Vibrio cholerae]HDV5471655.1 hypothetical protein [Vibrio cholerae]